MCLVEYIQLTMSVNYRASEEYWFHTSEQMALVGQHCPDIRHIMFMYQSEVCQLSYLAAFEHLVTLDIWGGCFYVDEFVELLEVRIGRGNAAEFAHGGLLPAAKPRSSKSDTKGTISSARVQDIDDFL